MVKVKYDALSGLPTGKAVAEFRCVPDKDTVMSTIRSGIIAKVVGASSAKVVYDDRKDESGAPRKDQVTGFECRYLRQRGEVYKKAHPI